MSLGSAPFNATPIGASIRLVTISGDASAMGQTLISQLSLVSSIAIIVPILSDPLTLNVTGTTATLRVTLTF